MKLLPASFIAALFGKLLPDVRARVVRRAGVPRVLGDLTDGRDSGRARSSRTPRR